MDEEGETEVEARAGPGSRARARGAGGRERGPMACSPSRPRLSTCSVPRPKYPPGQGAVGPDETCSDQSFVLITDMLNT